MEELELDKGLKIAWAGKEEFEQAFRRAHLFLEGGGEGRRRMQVGRDTSRTTSLRERGDHPAAKLLSRKKMSDVQLNPPLRIQPATAKKISAKSAQAHVSQFLDDHQERHVSARTQGDSTIIAQLQKLADALAQEQAMRKSK